MRNPSVAVLLNGFLIPSDQGNPAFCGAYLIAGPGRRVLYDCGHVGRRRWLLDALRDQGIGPADVDVVVVSHAHWDHLQNVDLFPRARVLLHAAELRRLDAPADLGTPAWTAAILAPLDVAETGDGDEVAPGVRVVHLPGHTPGSIGVTVTTDDGVAVLTGDAVATADALRSGRCLGRPADAAAADASVARVAGIADVVYPGHDRPFRVADGAYITDPVPITFRVPDPAVVTVTTNGAA